MKIMITRDVNSQGINVSNGLYKLKADIALIRIALIILSIFLLLNLLTGNLGIKGENYLFQLSFSISKSGLDDYPIQPDTSQKDNLHEDTVIKMQRTVCFGTCPSYSLTIFGNGTVIYEGEMFVDVNGTHTYNISKDKVDELVDEFYKINFFTLDDRYELPVTDLPTTIVSISIDGVTKKVVDYAGAPGELENLENKIDEIANSQRYVGNIAD